MEPRELWERNTVLAKAFCAGDDRVRLAQSALDEAQAERTRLLAAFAVVVGDDGTVAGMMGLQEREVRVARRTVGREGARNVAANLLTRMTDPTGEMGGEAGPVASETHASFPRAETSTAAAASAPYTAPTDRASNSYSAAAAEEQMWAEPPQVSGPIWSPSMDSVLVWSWHSGLDLQVVANELGLELRTVLQRVQVLAAEGHLVKSDQVASRDYSSGSRDYSGGSRDYSGGSRDYSSGSRDYSGRHRRNEDTLAEFSNAGAFGLGGLFSSAAWT
ncbi:hypothetical protein ACWGI8_24315 [Streptomyces sp. NPDC054841]